MLTDADQQKYRDEYVEALIHLLLLHRVCVTSALQLKLLLDAQVKMDAGDVLYLPDGWTHEVHTKGRTCTVNYGFPSLTVLHSEKHAAN